jgi:hypothetical protein
MPDTAAAAVLLWQGQVELIMPQRAACGEVSTALAHQQVSLSSAVGCAMKAYSVLCAMTDKSHTSRVRVCPSFANDVPVASNAGVMTLLCISCRSVDIALHWLPV